MAVCSPWLVRYRNIEMTAIIIVVVITDLLVTNKDAHSATGRHTWVVFVATA